MASTYVADNGRPLAEMTAAPSVQKGVPFEMRRCPYEGSRQGKQMNVSALKELTSGLDECLSDTVFLRKRYLAYRGIDKFNAGEFWRFNRAISGLPAFILRRSQNTYNEKSFPTRLAVLFKAAQGLHLAAEVLMLRAEGYEKAITSSGLYDLIESRNLFMDGDRACAGPPAMVEKFIESACDGLHGNDNDDWLLSCLDCDLDDVFRYSDAVTRIFTAKAFFEAENRLESLAFMKALGALGQTEKLKRVYSRFGVLVNRGEQDLLNFQKGLSGFFSSPEKKNAVDLQLQNEIASALLEISAVLTEEQAEICSRYMAANIARANEWLVLYKSLQSHILTLLGIPQELPDLELADIVGLGYMPVDIAAAASGVRVSYSGAEITFSVRGAGSKTVVFKRT